MGFISFVPRWFGHYTTIKNIASLRPADHIAIWDFSRKPLAYQHHGIVWMSGNCVNTILVCHVWSPFTDYQEAQADSCFRISTLAEFLYERNPKHLRLVEYHTSGLRELLSSWGEVHFTKSDLPEVVLARCTLLMGLGKGEFNIRSQNCEHAAHWCKTGEQWCKQSLTKGQGDIPFEMNLSSDRVDALHAQIHEVKAEAMQEVSRIVRLSGSLVFLVVNGNQYVQVTQGKQLMVVSNIEDATKFMVSCYAKDYNCVKISFYQEDIGCYMYSRSTLSCFRDVRMKKRNCFRGTAGLKWEFTSTGNLISMTQHRRYMGVRTDNVVVDVSVRGDAARFTLAPITKPIESATDSTQTKIPMLVNTSCASSHMIDSLQNIAGSYSPRSGDLGTSNSSYFEMENPKSGLPRHSV